MVPITFLFKPSTGLEHAPQSFKVYLITTLMRSDMAS